MPRSMELYKVQVRSQALAALLTRATAASGSSTSIINSPYRSSLRRITTVLSGLCTSQNTLCFEEARKRGREMTFEQTVAYALSEADTPERPGP